MCFFVATRVAGVEPAYQPKKEWASRLGLCSTVELRSRESPVRGLLFGYELGYLIPYFKNWVCSSPELFIESGVVSKASFSDIPCCVLYNTGETPYLFKNPVSVCSSIEIDSLLAPVALEAAVEDSNDCEAEDAALDELVAVMLSELALLSDIESANF